MWGILAQDFSLFCSRSLLDDIHFFLNAFLQRAKVFKQNDNYPILRANVIIALKINFDVIEGKLYCTNLSQL